METEIHPYINEFNNLLEPIKNCIVLPFLFAMILGVSSIKTAKMTIY